MTPLRAVQLACVGLAVGAWACEAPTAHDAPATSELAPPGPQAKGPLPGAAERELDSVPAELRAEVGEAELLRMRAWLDERYSPASVVATLKHGPDTIDCVARTKPLPPSGPTTGALDGPRLPIPEAVACPEGSMPMRRIALSELARLGKLERMTQPP